MLLLACGDDDDTTIDEPDEPAPGEIQVDLAGENEVPPVASPASGEVVATLTGNLLEVSGAFADLEADLMEVSGSAAHIHRGAVDEAGPVVFNLDVTSSDGRSGTLAGSFELTSEQMDLFEQGLLYVNLHSEVNPAGEIRGQLAPDQPSFAAVDATFDADLRPEGETDPVDSDAVGTATAVVRGNLFTVSGQFDGLTSPLMDAGDAGPAHVHEAPVDEDGPIVFPIAVDAAGDMRSGRLSVSRPLAGDELAALEAGDYYVNVHSQSYPAGEIRGQLTQR
jgi:hypothetical protein